MMKISIMLNSLCICDYMCVLTLNDMMDFGYGLYKSHRYTHTYLNWHIVF